MSTKYNPYCRRTPAALPTLGKRGQGMERVLDLIHDQNARYKNTPAVEATGLYDDSDEYGRAYQIPTDCFPGYIELKWDNFQEQIDRVSRYIALWNRHIRFVVKPWYEGNKA